MTNSDILKRVREIVARDDRFHRDAYIFVLSALEHTARSLPKRRHLTGQELSRGIADFAREQFGYMARLVLEKWGIARTIDFGTIVYLMIDEGLLSKTEEDRLEDFADVFDFRREFAWDRLRRTSLPERF